MKSMIVMIVLVLPVGVLALYAALEYIYPSYTEPGSFERDRIARSDRRIRSHRRKLARLKKKKTLKKDHQ